MAVPKKPDRRPASGRLNSVGLGQRELGELLDQFETVDKTGATAKRSFARWPFRHASVRVQVFHPGGAIAAISVACRNLSRAGISLLHSAYYHTGTKVRIHLPHPTRGEVPIDGQVTRCAHRSGVVHEIGVKFSRPLDVQEFLRPTPFEGCFSMERVNPEELTGNLVYVDDSEIDRRILKHFLRETKLRVAVVATPQEAMSCIDETTDLVVSDYHLSEGTGADLAMGLRQRGLHIPIFLTTCDTQIATPELIGSGAVNAFLSKPLAQDLLLRAIAEFLIIRRKPGTPEVRTAAGDGVAGQLAKGLSEALVQYGAQLGTLAQGGDAAGARKLCLQIASAAAPLHQKDIAELAAKTAEVLGRSKTVASSAAAIASLVAACQRGKAKSEPDVKAA